MMGTEAVIAPKILITTSLEVVAPLLLATTKALAVKARAKSANIIIQYASIFCLPPFQNQFYCLCEVLQIILTTNYD